MSLIDKLFDKSSWERFYEYKSRLHCSKRFKKELREFIDSEAYLSYADQGNVTGATGDSSGQRVIKTMEYILLKESGEYHIYSVRYAGQSS